MKRIVYTRPDGGVSIVVPAPKARRKGESEAEFMARLRAKVVPADATDVSVCEESDVPSDRTFRNAWCRATAVSDPAWRLGAVIGVDRAKAEQLHMDRIRRVRDRELAKLDIEYQRADERGDASAKADVAARKQWLRDIPQTFDLSKAQTPEALKAMWPDGLPHA